MKQISLFILISFLSIANAFSQRGKDGNYTVTTANAIINSYTNLTANTTAGASVITVASNALQGGIYTSNLVPGDLILIIQMQGASLNVDTYAANEYVTSNGLYWGPYTTPIGHLNDWSSYQELWGEILNYNNAGKFELAEVKSVAGTTTINLMCPLSNLYTASGHVQIVRVPRFINLTLNANMSAVPALWNGTTGGVVAAEINGTLLFNTGSKISATGAGFRGGVTEDNTLGAPPGSVNNIGFCASHVATQGAEKGEGIAGFYAEYDAIYSRYCKSAPANGGGGGGNHNAGGGGGSNVGTGTYTGKGVPSTTYNTSWNLEGAGFGGSISPGGGRGGYSGSTSDQNELTVGPNNTAWNGDYRRKEGGLGGHPLSLDATRIFAGGGGGAGDQNNTQGGNGGRGGGIAFLKVYGTISGPGTIEANGSNGVNANSAGLTAPQTSTIKYGNDAAGGAGGGGSVYISHVNTLPATLNLVANGGNGGNQVLSVGLFASSPTMEADGPGGGGSGGLISITAGNPIQLVQGGINGVTNSAHVVNFPPNGATAGASGTTTTNTSFYDILAANDTICNGASVTLTASTIGVPPSGALTWYSTPFGSTVVGSGNSFTTPVLAATTTYYVGICPGSFRRAVTVLVGANPQITGNAAVFNATCSSPGAITGLSASGGVIPYSYSWSGVSTPSANLTNAGAGTYTLTVTDAVGCSSTSAPYVISGATLPTINATNVVLTPQSCIGTFGSIAGITTTGNNLSYTWTNSTGTTLNLSNLVAGSYSLSATDANGCVVTAGPFVISYIAGPAVNTNSIVLSPEHCGQGNGSITGISATGNGLTYLWTPGNGNTLNQNGLSAGNYSLTVTDAIGCTSQVGPYNIINTPPPSINNTPVIIGENCGQGNGSISNITVAGGATPYTYSWSNASATTIDLNNLAAGSYTLYVVDVNNCTDSLGPIVVNSIGGPTIQTSVMVLSNVGCEGQLGSIMGVTVSGVGLTTLWSNNVSTLSNPNLTPGNYTFTVTDVNNCVATQTFTVGQDFPPVINSNALNIIQPTCLQLGTINGLQVTGGTGSYSYDWSTMPFQSNLNINNVGPGNYSLVVTDNGNGCTDTLNNIIISPPTYPIANFTFSPVDPDLNEIITFTNTSTGNWNVQSWTIEGQNFNNSPIPYSFGVESVYPVQLIVTSPNGCSDTIIQFVSVYDEFIIPNVITPNQDGTNDLLFMAGLKPNTSVSILNRWGDLIFSTDNYLNDWNGKDQQGTPLTDGVYTIIVNNAEHVNYHCFVHLIR